MIAQSERDAVINIVAVDKDPASSLLSDFLHGYLIAGGVIPLVDGESVQVNRIDRYLRCRKSRRYIPNLFAVSDLHIPKLYAILRILGGVIDLLRQRSQVWAIALLRY